METLLETTMKRIAISAGHYPEKAGARHDDLVEHDLAVEWVDKLLDIFDECYDFDICEPEFEFIPVPTGTLRDKVAFINRSDIDYAIEIHFNSAGVKASGCETLYMPGSARGKYLAETIQELIVEALGIRDRGVKEGLYWRSRERTNTPLYFLRRTNCPAVIIEPEFLQSYDENIGHKEIVDFCFAMIDALLNAIEAEI